MDKFEKRSIKSYNKKADNYEKTFDGRFTIKFKEKLLEIVHIPTDGKVIDIACGNGKLLSMLAKKGTFKGYGIDISENMIKQAEKINPNMNFLVGSCENLPYLDNTFDVITVSAAFHHFPRPDAFVNEAFRILKTNGTIYIAEVYYPTIIRNIFNLFINKSRAGDVKFYSPFEIETMLKEGNFSGISINKDKHIQIISAYKTEN